MTFNEFLVRLSEGKGKFRLNSNERVRTEEDGLCPLQFVFNTFRGYTSAAKKAGMNEELVSNIMNGADWSSTDKTLKAMRSDMLKVLGLETTNEV